MSNHLLAVKDLRVCFTTYAGVIHAVNGMSFEVGKGEIFGLVGESGCGKSVTGMAILQMVTYPGEITGGQVMFHEEDLLKKSPAEMQAIRGRKIAMIFQDPSASLNPVFTCGNQIGRIIRLHNQLSPREAERQALEMLAAVALPQPRQIMRSYPHELSGGMQQRVMIAMALASGAELLIADEPTTALDVTIQAQILDLLVTLKEKQQVSILLITHNLGVVAETCQRVGVAYAGTIVEIGSTGDVMQHMKHPYTQGLLAAIPRPGSRGKTLQAIEGSVPDGLQLFSGCSFAPRCPMVMDVCRQSPPPMYAVGDNGHLAACYLYKDGEQR